METSARMNCTIAFYVLKIFHRIHMKSYRLQSIANVSKTPALLAQRGFFFFLNTPRNVTICFKQTQRRVAENRIM